MSKINVEDIEKVEGEVIETTSVDVSEKQMTELATITDDAVVVSINFDFTKLKEQAEEVAAYYDSLEVTDENYKDVKKQERYLAGQIREIDDRRKEIGRKLTAPKKQLDTEINSIAALLKESQDKVKAAYAVYDQKRLDEIKAKVEKKLENSLKKSGLRPEYASRVVVGEVVLSRTLKSYQENIDEQISRLLAEQSLEDRARTSIEALMNAYNTKVTQKITDSEPYVKDVLKAFESGVDADEAINQINAELTAEFDKILANEEKIRQEAIEAERARAEEAAREAAAQELAAQQAMQMQDMVPEAVTQDFVPEIPTQDPVQGQIPTVPVEAAVAENAWAQADWSNIEAVAEPVCSDTVPTAIQTPERDMRPFVMHCNLTGAFADLADLGEEFKALCEKHNVEFAAIGGEYLTVDCGEMNIA